MRRCCLALLLAAGCYDLDAVERPSARADAGARSDGGRTGDGGGPSDEYVARILEANPVAYWRLGDEGATAVDAVGDLDATIRGDCDQAVPGVLSDDGAIALSGGCYLEVEEASELTFVEQAPFTVECWMYRQVQPDYYAIAVGRVTDAPVEGYKLEIEYQNGIFSRCRDGGCETAGTAALTLDTWHHVAVVYDGTAAVGAMRILVDGVRDSEQEGTGNVSLLATAAPFLLGDASPDASLDATLDECAVFAQALPDELIAEHADLP